MAPRHSLSPRAALLTALVAELVYIAGRTWIRDVVAGPIALEVATTALRLASIAFYAWLFMSAIRQTWRPRPARTIHPLLLAAFVTMVLAYLLAGFGTGMGMGERLVFVLATPLVALREEIFYRFILQGALQRRMHPLAAIAIATGLFVVYHAGTVPMDPFSIIAFAAGGFLLGAIYERTGSLSLVVVAHLAIDLAALVSVPVLGLAHVIGAMLAVIVAVLMAWSLDESNRRMGIR